MQVKYSCHTSGVKHWIYREWIKVVWNRLFQDSLNECFLLHTFDVLKSFERILNKTVDSDIAIITTKTFRNFFHERVMDRFWQRKSINFIVAPDFNSTEFFSCSQWMWHHFVYFRQWESNILGGMEANVINNSNICKTKQH